MTVTLSPLRDRTAELASSVAARSAAPSRAFEHLPFSGSQSPPAPSSPSRSSRASCAVSVKQTHIHAHTRTRSISMKMHAKHCNEASNQRTYVENFRDGFDCLLIGENFKEPITGDQKKPKQKNIRKAYTRITVLISLHTSILLINTYYYMYSTVFLNYI